MTRKQSPSWVLELPLAVRPDQARRLQAHLEAARCLYNALLGEAKKRLNRMRSDPRMARGTRHPTHTEAGTQRRLLALAQAVRLCGIRSARLRQRSSRELDC